MLLSLMAYSQSEHQQDSSKVVPNTNPNDTIEVIKGPILSFDSTTINLGTIPEDTIIHRTFHFQNTGSDTLNILSIKADCSCTVPEVSKKIYLPTESGSLHVTYNSKQNIGRFLQYVTIFHNGDKGYTYVKLEGFVERKL